MITQYAPQLPVGPPSFMAYPPVTPHSGLPAPAVADISHLHKQEREEQQHLALWQQQQQQQQQWATALQLKLAEQQQLHPLIIPPGSAHHPAFSTSHGHAPHSIEPMAFTFNPEDVAAMRSGARVGVPGSVEQLAAVGLIPPGQQIIQPTPIPFLDSYQLAMNAGRLQEEHAGGLIPLIQAGVPASVEQQQVMLLQQQQQQQQLLAHVAAVNNTSLHELMEFFQQCDMIVAQMQKEPALMQDPTVNMMLKRREVFIQQMRQMATAVQMEQLQRMQQEAILQHQHQELLQKQQQQQQFILTRPPLPEEVHSRNRPGVIVGHK